MKYFTLCIVASLACAFSVTNGASLGGDRDAQYRVAPHLIGGDQVSTSEREYYVGFRLYNDWNDFKNCGGVRLNEKWMLTTAECLDNMKYKNVRITTAVNHTQFGHAYYELRKLKYTIHAKHDAGTKTNNLALVETSDFNEWTSTNSHLKLPSNNEQYGVYNQQTAVVTSYNIAQAPSTEQEVIKVHSLRVKMIEPAVCKQAYGSSFDENAELCTLAINSKSKLDQRDVGAPLVFDFMNKNTLLGLVSDVKTSPTSGEALVVFVKISPYVDWINKIMKFSIKNKV